jgi:Ca2+-binding RTX toxin-like protein
VDYGASRKPISVDLDPGRKGVFGTGSDGAAGDLFNSVENVLGGRRDDTISGDNAGNLLRGGKGDDTLLGGGGRDRLFGERGDDRLDGGRGRDLLVGGGGEDTFVFGTGGGKDTLRGFRPDVDTLDLSGAGFANRKQAIDAF